MPQYAVLTILATKPRLTSAELARKAFVTPQTIYELIKGLEKKGLLARAQEVHNKKRSI